MKKIFIAIMSFIVLASCADNKSGIWSELKGEWDVATLNGSEMVIDTNTAKQPFLGFDGNGRMYGCAGCNNIIYNINTPDDPAVIDFSSVGTTMMMCPDMETEQNFLDALKNVVKFNYLNENELEFLDKDGAVKMTLRKK